MFRRSKSVKSSRKSARKSGAESATALTRPAVDSDNGSEPLPRHVAIIMDGNGRWAKGRLMPRVEGHAAGAKAVRQVIEESVLLGIRYLTLFSFSTENWLRPADEVKALMNLFVRYLNSERELMHRENIRLRAIGDLDRLPASVRKVLLQVMDETSKYSRLDLVLAVSYGGRDEIVHSVRQIARKIERGEICSSDITRELIESNLYAPDIPYPDLLIRTSDEFRISNFLLWQLAYSEIVVSPMLWPEFDKQEFRRCLSVYAGRTRRFGLTDEQLTGDIAGQRAGSRQNGSIAGSTASVAGEAQDQATISK